ncbi:hypothetical protein NMG60_11001132 [Bertholletia excelsa]
MASSENLASMEPWSFRPALTDSWISEALARDTETLTKALQKSISSDPFPSLSSFFNLSNPTPPTPSSTASASDHETPASKRPNPIPPVNAKPSKRKSRASKRTTTTFITADPANFRQMVQQVTGVKFGATTQLSVVPPPLLKPEPQRPVSRMLQGCLPTLDTSAFLLDHHQQATGPATTEMGAAEMQPSVTMPDSALEAGGAAAFHFDSFSSFPTLESWKVM